MSCKKCKCGKGTCGTIERRIGPNDFNPELVLNTGNTYNGRKCIAIKDVITLICTEFVKQNKFLIDSDLVFDKRYIWKNRYLKMNYKARRKLSEKLLAKMEEGL